MRLASPLMLSLFCGIASAGSLYLPSNNGSGAVDHGTVLEFDSTTGQFRRQVIPTLPNDQITGVTLGPDRNLYVAARNANTNTNGRVLMYSRGGVFRRAVVSAGVLSTPLGVRFGPDGNLYVVNNTPGADQVLKFKGSKLIGAVASNLVVPQELAFGADGLLYVTNAAADSVSKLDPVTRKYLSDAIASATGGMDAPIGLAFGPDGNLYVASFPLNAILKFAASGAYIGVFASLQGLGVNDPLDLVFGPDGNLYVYAHAVGGPIEGKTVLRFSGSTGAFIDVFIAAGLLGGGNTGMLFVDPGCARYGDYGFRNRCFTAGPP